MSTPEVFIHASGDLLASAAAARTVTRIADAIAAEGHAHLVLTGGGIGTKVLAAIAAAPARDAVDWSRVEFWWGDERFLATGDPERNETGARAALLDALSVEPSRIHVIPGPDGPDGDDPDAAAARYARELAASAGPGASVPAFDVLMLGIGPEGHIASIFPGSPAAHSGGSVAAVRDCPKPPPTRISLTFGALQAAREVWVLASGAEKAEAVARAMSGVSQVELPAAGARGRARTLFLLDEAAAAKLPVASLDERFPVSRPGGTSARLAGCRRSSHEPAAFREGIWSPVGALSCLLLAPPGRQRVFREGFRFCEGLMA